MITTRVLPYILGFFGLGATLHFVHKWFFPRRKWQKVGSITELLIHPLKSARCMEVDEAEATLYGLACGDVMDRSFVVLRNGTFETGRSIPKLVTLDAIQKDSVLTISDQHGHSIHVNIQEVNEARQFVKFRFRENEAHGYDCGDKVAQWLSQILCEGNKELRLIYKGDHSWTRDKRKYPYQLKNHKTKDTPFYADCGSYMVMTQSSLDDLNARLQKPVTFRYFRPPIIIGGTEPYDEDTWEYIKIGQHVVLRVIKPCERCLLTQIDPQNGQKSSEHFECLCKYRMVSWPEDLANAWKRNPILGAHCGIDRPGTIKVGDPVWVTRQNPLQWKIE